MKPAVEWLNQVGEAVMFEAFVGGSTVAKADTARLVAHAKSHPQSVHSGVEKLIKRIQIDALEHALGLGGINIGGQDCVFKMNIQHAIQELHEDPAPHH